MRDIEVFTRLPVTGLFHASLQVPDIASYPPTEVPDEVVEVASLYSRLPVAAQDGVQLAGEQARQREQPHLERDRCQQRQHLVAGTWRRVGIHVQSDADLLRPGEPLLQVVRHAHLCQIDPRTALDERGFDGGAHAFAPTFDAEAETERRELPANRFEVGVEAESLGGYQQGEVHVFGEAWQSVEDAERGAPVERRVLVELGAPQPEQRQFLDDFLQGVLVVGEGMRLVTGEQRLERDVHSVPVPCRCSQRRNASTFRRL